MPEAISDAIPVAWFVCTKCGFGRKAKVAERHAICDRSLTKD